MPVLGTGWHHPIGTCGRMSSFWMDVKIVSAGRMGDVVTVLLLLVEEEGGRDWREPRSKSSHARLGAWVLEERGSVWREVRNEPSHARLGALGVSGRDCVESIGTALGNCDNADGSTNRIRSDKNVTIGLSGQHVQVDWCRRQGVARRIPKHLVPRARDDEVASVGVRGRNDDGSVC
jgi:hypothetical protein